jgi:hypothetical protein
MTKLDSELAEVDSQLKTVTEKSEKSTKDTGDE